MFFLQEVCRGEKPRRYVDFAFPANIYLSFTSVSALARQSSSSCFKVRRLDLLVGRKIPNNILKQVPIVERVEKSIQKWVGLPPEILIGEICLSPPFFFWCILCKNLKATENSAAD